MLINKENVKIYSAGKTWVAPVFQDLRDNHGFNIIARWIDVQKVLKGPDDTFAAETHDDEDYKRFIWDEGCKQDCLSADMGLMFTSEQDGNMQSGALVECGHVTAFGKPWYIIGTCESVEPVGNSDRAWRSQSCVYWRPDISDPVEGANWAINHYLKNYAHQWLHNRAVGIATYERNRALEDDRHFVPQRERFA
jgi:nucleoside 2-deoxyribosyltransferase